MKLWFSIGTLVFSLAFTLYGLSTLDLYDINERPGPGYFPLIIGAGLIIATAINVYKDVAEYRQVLSLKNVTSPQKSESKVYVKDTLAVTLCIALLIFSMSTLGAIISMLLFMAVFLFYFNRGKVLQNLVYAVVFPVAVYVLFDVWLQAGLPDGLLSYFY